MNFMSTPKPKRRWYQFSLRALLVFVLIAGAGLGWLGSKLQQARRQQQAVAGLRNSALNRAGKFGAFVQRGDGGLLQRWFGDRFAPVVGARLGNDIEHGGLIHLKGLTHLQTLYFDDSNVTDTDLAYLIHVPQLRELSLRNTNVTNAGLAHVDGLQQLGTLDLWQTDVSDAGLVHLGRLRQLRTLNLGYSKITDGGLAHLTELSQLETLHIEGTAVTDAGLADLRKATQLQTLYFDHAHITASGIKKLQAALPDCEMRNEPMPEEWGDSRRSTRKRRWQAQHAR